MTKTMVATIALSVGLLAGCSTDRALPPETPEPTATYGAEGPRSPQARTIVATARRTGRIEVSSSTSTVDYLESPRQVNGSTATVPLVLVVRRVLGTWLEVSLPVRPNGSYGLVPAADFALSGHNFQIEITLSQTRLRVLDGDQEIFVAPVGVAKQNTPTPGGTYYTVELVEPTDPKGVYGPYAFGLSGYSDVHQSFNGGPGQLGIHGTNEPDKVGTRVSNGCIRLRNTDITALVNLGLPLGTPVIVRS